MNLLLPALFSIGLLGCAAKPAHVIVAPVIESNPATTYDSAKAELKVIDMRTNKNIVQILRDGEAAELYPSQDDLTKTVTEALEKAYKSHSLILTESLNRISITIDSAKVVVDQGAMSHTAKTEIIISATADNTKFKVTKKFKATATTEGALRADMAALERDFSNQLSKVLTQIVQSDELKDVLY